MQSIGQYTLGEELGRGSMGVVFRGFDPAIGRAVAIKLVHISQYASAADQAEAKLRFTREASAAGRLSHPNIVIVYQFGEQDDLEYLVQELVEGESLEKRLSNGHAQDPKAVISLLGQIADALDYAHGEGIVHRDVKPANIMVRGDGKAKITDFGIARIASQAITRTGYSMGTLAYMAPEQIMTAKVSGKADEFSLAVIAFQMLCGQRPFVAETDPALIFKIVSEEPPRLDAVDRSFSPRVSDVLLRAMAKNPDQRFATCAEFVQELDAALNGATSADRTAPTLAAAVVVPRNASKPQASQPTRRSGAGKYAAAAAGAVVVVAGAWGLWTLREKAASPPAAVQQSQSATITPGTASANKPGETPRTSGTPEDIPHGPAPSVKKAGGAVKPGQAPIADGAAVPSRKSKIPEEASLNVAGNIQADRLLKQVAPEYPPPAKEAGVEGSVRFSADIGKGGRIRGLSLLSGNPLLVEAARKAVEQWTYKPTLLDGKPVAVKTQIEVSFKFDRPADGRAYQALIDQGRQLLKEGKRTEANESAQKALLLDPTRWEAYSLAGHSFLLKKDAMSLAYLAPARLLAPKSMVAGITTLIQRCETRLREKGLDKDYEVAGKLTAINTELKEITVESDAHQSYVMKLSSSHAPIVTVKRGPADSPQATRKSLSALHKGDRVTVSIFGDLRALAVIVEDR
jgi:TonB family protein